MSAQRRIVTQRPFSIIKSVNLNIWTFLSDSFEFLEYYLFIYYFAIIYILIRLFDICMYLSPI